MASGTRAVLDISFPDRLLAPEDRIGASMASCASLRARIESVQVVLDRLTCRGDRGLDTWEALSALDGALSRTPINARRARRNILRS